jgi:hypothetical protein
LLPLCVNKIRKLSYGICCSMNIITGVSPLLFLILISAPKDRYENRYLLHCINIRLLVSDPNPNLRLSCLTVRIHGDSMQRSISIYVFVINEGFINKSLNLIVQSCSGSSVRKLRHLGTIGKFNIPLINTLYTYEMKYVPILGILKVDDRL